MQFKEYRKYVIYPIDISLMDDVREEFRFVEFMLYLVFFLIIEN
jgi:hypothetical protein